jgi:hypothetical protein
MWSPGRRGNAGRGVCCLGSRLQPQIPMTLLILGHILGVSRADLPRAEVPRSGLVLGLKPVDHAGVGGALAKDWQAVASAITARLAELDMTQAELQHRAGLALETVRELQHNLRPRRRSPRTLAAVSEALGWPADHLAALADGLKPGDPDAGDPVLVELGTIREALTMITGRLDAIERRLADDGGES